MTRTVSIVGAGRVGRTLGRRLRELGWRIEAVVARADEHARAAVQWIGAGRPFGRIAREVFSARVILVTTPDSAIADAAENLARVARKSLKGTTVLHTSGALDSGVLEPLERLHAATGSLHPMQTFTGKTLPKLKGVAFAIEGVPGARRVAARIGRELGGVPVVIRAQDKAAYHAAGTMAAGHALALMEAATEMLVRSGFAHKRAIEALLPLTRQMLDNFETGGPRAAWTGPVAREDYEVLAKHAKALRQFPSEFREAYAALAILSGRVLADDARTAIAKIRRAIAKG
jgi:predicted short-subunit dehydrogenase-like oxidoreductase (DUF2520 family)